MQDQGKRLLLAVALALGVMLLWNVIFPSKKADPPKPAPAGQQLVKQSSQVGVSLGSPVTALPETPAETIELVFPDRFRVTLSSATGGIVSWKLTDPRFERDQSKGELLPVAPGTGALSVNFAKSTYVLPPNTVWKGTKVSDTEVRFTASAPSLTVDKTFTFIPQNYLVKMNVTATVDVPEGKLADQNLAVSVFSFQDPDKIEKGAGQSGDRAWHSSTLRGEEIFHTSIGGLLENPRLETGIEWTGFEHPYMFAGYSPRKVPGATVEKRTFALEPRGVMRTDITFGTQTMRKGSPALSQEVVAYLGPKNYKALEGADEVTGYTNFRETVDLGWFAFIGKPLLWLLLKFHDFVLNWGLAIILLTILVKTITLYWTTKSMRSMKAMAALAPQVKLMQAKYQGDNQRLQVESMALYKEHKVSPIAGCLPLFLQMPIWLALYKMLSSAGELYQQPFLPGWIDDLTATDPYYILPFILLITMFLQARLTPASIDSRQQKMMQYGIPLIFGVMSFFFPAGLTLYIFTNTILSALHSIYMNKWDRKTIQTVAKIKESVDAAIAKEAAGDGKKPGAKNGASTAKAKPVIEAKGVERPVEDRDDDDESEAPASVAGGGSSASRPRNKGKKKKRR